MRGVLGGVFCGFFPPFVLSYNADNCCLFLFQFPCQIRTGSVVYTKNPPNPACSLEEKPQQDSSQRHSCPLISVEFKELLP